MHLFLINHMREAANIEGAHNNLEVARIPH